MMNRLQFFKTLGVGIAGFCGAKALFGNSERKDPVFGRRGAWEAPVSAIIGTRQYNAR